MGMLVIIVAGFVLMAIAYIMLGPAPPLQPLLGPLFGSWLIWASLGLVGLGAGMAFVPLLPALLEHLDEARYPPSVTTALNAECGPVFQLEQIFLSRSQPQPHPQHHITAQDNSFGQESGSRTDHHRGFMVSLGAGGHSRGGLG